MVDVGNGRWGGSIENPGLRDRGALSGRRDPRRLPLLQESTGKFYLFLGDEISGGAVRAWAGEVRITSRYDSATGEGGVQGRMSGYLHVIDFTDPENPRDVARYEVPEAGAHNLWVERGRPLPGVLQGRPTGRRRVRRAHGRSRAQGREIAIYKPQDPGGFLPNQVSVWGGSRTRATCSSAT